MREGSEEGSTGRVFEPGFARGIVEQLKAAAGLLISILLVLTAGGWILLPLRWALGVHHLLGLAVATLVLTGVAWALRALRKSPVSSAQFGTHPRVGLAASVFLVLVVATYAFGAISFSFLKLGWAVYDVPRLSASAAPHDEVLSGAIVDFYGWHLLDAIPLVQFWDLFPAARPPAIPGDFTARFLLLCFRVLLLAEAVRILKKQIDFHEQFKAALRLAQNRPSNADRALMVAFRAAEEGGSAPDRIDVRLAMAQRLLNARRVARAMRLLGEVRTILAQEHRRQDLTYRRAQWEHLESLTAERSGGDTGEPPSPPDTGAKGPSQRVS